MDGIVKSKDITLVEAKGIRQTKRWLLEEKIEDLPPEICQILLYSFLSGWKNVYLVWAVEEKLDDLKVSDLKKKLKSLHEYYFDNGREDMDF